MLLLLVAGRLSDRHLFIGPGPRKISLLERACGIPVIITPLDNDCGACENSPRHSLDHLRAPTATGLPPAQEQDLKSGLRPRTPLPGGFCTGCKDTGTRKDPTIVTIGGHGVYHQSCYDILLDRLRNNPSPVTHVACARCRDASDSVRSIYRNKWY